VAVDLVLVQLLVPVVCTTSAAVVAAAAATTTTTSTSATITATTNSIAVIVVIVVVFLFICCYIYWTGILMRNRMRPTLKVNVLKTMFFATCMAFLFGLAESKRGESQNLSNLL